MRKLLVIALCVLAQVPPIAAQGASEWRDSTVRLGEQIKALRDSMAQVDSSLVEVARSGKVVVMASPDQRDRAIAVLEPFRREIGRWFGEALPSPDGFRLDETVDLNRGYGRDDSKYGAITILGLPANAKAPHDFRVLAPARVLPDLVDQYGRLMLQAAPPKVEWWLAASLPNFSMEPLERRHLGMYALVTGVGRIERGCVNGDLEDCAQALNLRPVTGDSAGPYFPLVLRGDLLLFALEAGGPDAWPRFVAAADSSAGEGLSAAMQMPLDSVIARWRASLLEVRPTQTTWDGSLAALALVWGAAITLLTWGASRWA